MEAVVRPYALLAELTYSCPLHCPYCSNPVRSETKDELSAEEWRRVIREAVSLGVLQIGFSGGEPLQRPDLEKLIEVAHEAGAYTNLITSAIGLTERRAAALVNAGLTVDCPPRRWASAVPTGLQCHDNDISGRHPSQG